MIYCIKYIEVKHVYAYRKYMYISHSQGHRMHHFDNRKFCYILAPTCLVNRVSNNQSLSIQLYKCLL